MTDNETKKKTKTNPSKRKKKNETTQEEKWVLGKKKKRKHGKREIEQYRGKDKLNTKRVYIYGDRDGKPETDRYSFCAL